MSLERNVFLLVAGACALALIAPMVVPHGARPMGAIVSTAPPLVIEDGGAPAHNRALSPVQQEATGALARLRQGK